MTPRFTDEVSLETALAHGRAHHARGPWRFDTKDGVVRYEKGTPVIDDDGNPILDKQGRAKLSWSPALKHDIKSWDKKGWILDGSPK